MEEPIRVLQVLGRLDRGGAETMVMNLYRCIDRTKMQFDFVIHTEDMCDYTEEIKALGGKIYAMERFQASTVCSYCRSWRVFFREHPQYRIIHGHMRSTASLYLYEAKKAGLVTIVHSHNTSSGRGISAVVKNMLQYPLRYEADYLFACSVSAGIWLYGKRACRKENFRLLANGISPERFRFDELVRKDKRGELLRAVETVPGTAAGGEAAQDAQDVTVFLHIGRLEEQKNHLFLLRVMKAVVEKRKNAVLLLCGAGPLEEKIKETAGRYGLGDCVRFLGVRDDVPLLMQAADGMLFPSLFEGLPVTLIEAQAAGLPVLMSDRITKEVILTDLVKEMPLSESPQRWAQEALCMADQAGTAQKRRVRGKYADAVAGAGYDVKKNAADMERFYRIAAERAAGRRDGE